MRYISVCLLFILLLASPLWADTSEQQRIALSDQMMKDIHRTYGSTSDIPEEWPLTQVFRNLVAHAGRKNINYRLRVVDSSRINAYALPDGRIVFFSELIKSLPTDDMAPLAWVAAHEISHIEMRHGEKQMTRSLASGILLSLVLGRASGWVQAVGGISYGLLMSGYSRVDEYEADRKALELMRASGYDPNGALTTLRLFQDLEGRRRGMRVFPTHPRAGDRMSSVVAWMQGSGVAVSGAGGQGAGAPAGGQGQQVTTFSLDPIDLTLDPPRPLERERTVNTAIVPAGQ
ncbi:MAG: M48 family metallopeptidase [Candidatus Eremiobacteraeota bacterium]|nr:M48 family metallopeptidase [Candidatus Eremiobacteraeota bacterium]